MSGSFLQVILKTLKHGGTECLLWDWEKPEKKHAFYSSPIPGYL